MYPFVAKSFNYNAKLHQDNDPKHSSVLCRTTLKEANIEWVKAPPQSPDLNPVEWVWSDLKRFVRAQFCRTTTDVVNAIQKFHEQMTPQYCAKYINRLQKV